jgi:hypothetical protein
MATGIPSVGYKTYYAGGSEKRFHGDILKFKGDSIENDLIRVKFGSGGVSSMYDKVQKTGSPENRKILWRRSHPDGSTPQWLGKPGACYHGRFRIKPVCTSFKTIRAVESPLRYIVEKRS